MTYGITTYLLRFYRFCLTSEPVGRASEPARRALDPVGRATKEASRASDSEAQRKLRGSRIQMGKPWNQLRGLQSQLGEPQGQNASWEGLGGDGQKEKNGENLPMWRCHRQGCTQPPWAPEKAAAVGPPPPLLFTTDIFFGQRTPICTHKK